MTDKPRETGRPGADLRKWWLALALLAGLAIAGLFATSPAENRVYRIAMVTLTAVDLATQDGFREGLAELGHRQGHDILFDAPPPAGSADRLDGLVAEVLAKSPDLVLVSSTPGTQAVRRATRGATLPVVFAPVNDPVGAGIVGSLKAPGGNLTGIRLPTGDKRRLEWLKELAPGIRRVLLPYSPGDKSALETVAQVREVATRLDLELVEVPVGADGSIEALLANLPPRIDAVFIPRDSRIEADIQLFVSACRERRLPLSVPAVAQVRAGALVSYGFVHREIGRQAARLADQILHGVSPAVLPVETAESYLAINLAAAREIGLTVPDHVLRQAAVVVRP